MEFKKKLLLFVLLSIIFVSASISLFWYNETYKLEYSSIKSTLSSFSTYAVDTIDRFMFYRQSEVAMMNSDPILKSEGSDPKQLTERMIEYRNTYKTYSSFSIFDMSGNRIADTSGLNINEPYPGTGVYDIINNKTGFISGSEVRMSKTLKVPTVFFITPIKNGKGETFRILVARISVSKFEELFQTTELLDGSSPLGFDLVDGDGMVIYSNHDADSILQKANLHGIRFDSINLEGPSVFETSSDSGEKILLSIEKERGKYGFSGNGWFVISHFELKPLLSEFEGMLLKVFIFLIVTIILATGLTYLVIGRMTSSIKTLTRLMQQLEKGNFKARADIKTKDEFETLGNAFNQLAAVLDNTDEDRKRVDRAKTQFLSITSHELRSPMTPMKAQLQMLQGGYLGKVTKEQKDSLDIILRNADRLDRILQDFLELSRIEAGRIKFIFNSVNVKKNVSEVCEYMRGFMPEKKIIIVPQIDKRIPEIEADADRLSQVLRNLISNAVKFSPVGGTIEVSAELEGSHILFKVKDYGIGIEQENIQKLFNPFFQVNKEFNRDQSGTGLGLAICKGIVESQNGKIWVETESGKGSTFFFTLPLIPVREIKPVNLMFSSQTNIEEKLSALFNEVLGPMGKSEFDSIRLTNKLKIEELHAYVEELMKRNIITNESAVYFKESINKIFR